MYYTSVPWIRSCSAYSEPMTTSHAFTGLAGSRQTLLRMRQRAPILKVWSHIQKIRLHKCGNRGSRGSNKVIGGATASNSWK